MKERRTNPFRGIRPFHWLDEHPVAGFLAIVFAFIAVVVAILIVVPPDPRPEQNAELPGYTYSSPGLRGNDGGVAEWCSGPNRIYYAPFYGSLDVVQNDAQCNGGSG